VQFKNIQAARAIAANAVIFFHLQGIEKKYGHGSPIISDNAAWGACGVDLFFVVSGFIMATIAARESSRTFILSRLSRIFPIYWFYTAVVLAFSLLAPHMLAERVPAPTLWRSLLLVPDVASPVLAIGWSLTHELYFYAVFAVLLAFGFVRPAALFVWALLCVIGHETITIASPVLAVVFHPMTLEFILGVCVGLAVKAGYSRFSRAAGMLGVAMLFLSFFGYAPTEVYDGWNGWHRVFAFCVPFALIIYSVTAKEDPNATRTSPLVSIGNATYSIYLSHTLLLSALGRIFMALPVRGVAAEIVFIVFCLVATNLFGLASYRFIEKPCLVFFRKKIYGSQKP